MTAAPLSGVIGGPLSGALLGLHQKAGLAGWQWMFLLEGIPAIILGGLVWRYLVDRPALAPWLNDEQRQWLQQTLEREAAEATYESGTDPLASFRLGQVWILALVYFGLNTVSYGMSLWLPKLIKSVSDSNDFTIGVLSGIPYVAAAVAMVTVGWHSDRSGERRWHTAVPAFAGAIALGFAAHVTSVVPAIILVSVAVLGVFSMMGPFWAVPTSLLSGTAAATGIALINSVGNLGGFFGPYIIGVLRTSTGHFKGGLLVVAGALAASGALILTVKLRREA
jgi:ACS family tartrate transporter-like MFS transporter